MSHCPRLTAFAACLLVLITAGAGELRAEAAGSLVKRGNQAFESGELEQALSLYDEASVEVPESAEIYFNRGAVYYRQEDYEKAAEALGEAALRSKGPELTSRAKFNLGNCAFRQAQRQRDSDLKKAIEHCEESIAHYQEARDLDAEYQEAAENIEIVRLFVKVLLDEQKKQQEQQQQQDQNQDQQQQQDESQEQQQQGGDDEQQDDQQKGEEEQSEEGEDEQQKQEGQEEQEQQQGEDQQGEDQQQEGEDEAEQQEAEAEMMQESADDILDEEKKNQDERRPVRPAGGRPVDRDW